jgi:hypothetical protein
MCSLLDAKRRINKAHLPRSSGASTERVAGKFRDQKIREPFWAGPLDAASFAKNGAPRGD